MQRKLAQTEHLTVRRSFTGLVELLSSKTFSPDIKNLQSRYKKHSVQISKPSVQISSLPTEVLKLVLLASWSRMSGAIRLLPPHYFMARRGEISFTSQTVTKWYPPKHRKGLSQWFFRLFFSHSCGLLLSAWWTDRQKLFETPHAALAPRHALV